MQSLPDKPLYLPSAGARGFSHSSGRYTSTSPNFRSVSGSAAGSCKPGVDSPAEAEEPMDEDVRPSVTTEEEIDGWLDEPLRAFLERFSEHPSADLAILHTRPMIAVLEQLGYVLEERLPPEEKLEQRDLSVFGYLQIADRLPSNNIIALDLDEFNQLIADVVRNQYGVFARSLRPRPITIEELRALAHIVVRDPTGVLRGPSELQQFKPPTSALSASSIFPEDFQAAEGFLKSFRSALLATTRQAATSAVSQQQTPVTPKPQVKPTSASVPQYAPLAPPQPQQTSSAVPSDQAESAEQPDDTELVEMSEQELGGTFGDTAGFDPLNLDVLHHLPPIQTPTIGSHPVIPKKPVPKPEVKKSVRRKSKEHHKKEKRARRVSPQEKSPEPTTTVSAPELGSTSRRGTSQRAAKVQAIVQMKTSVASSSKATAETYSEEELQAEEKQGRVSNSHRPQQRY